MVDPVTAALTGIALVTKITDHIKSGINAYKSVAEVGEQIDLLFKGEQECMKARNKKAKGYDNFSTESVAQEIIDHKLAQEKLREVATMIDMRFGHGTWAGILAERQRRITEAREAKKQAEIERRRKQHEWEENLKTALITILVFATLLTVAVTAFVYAR